MSDKDELEQFIEEEYGSLEEIEKWEEELELNKLEKTKLKEIIKKFLKKLEIKNKKKLMLVDNTEKFINEFEKIVITCKEKGNFIIIRNILKFMANSVQAELFYKYYFIKKEYFSKNIKDINLNQYLEKSLTLDIDTEEIGQKEMNFFINEIPIISAPQDEEAIFSNLMTIGEINNNKFVDTYNFCGVLIKPLGIFIVKNANHSVNSALINKDNTEIKQKFEVIDISPNFQKYKFNGKSYINITTSKKINDNLLKNNSEPFTYSLGLMFEMARILKKHNIDLTEKYLQK